MIPIISEQLLGYVDCRKNECQSINSTPSPDPCWKISKKTEPLKPSDTVEVTLDKDKQWLENNFRPDINGDDLPDRFNAIDLDDSFQIQLVKGAYTWMEDSCTRDSYPKKIGFLGYGPVVISIPKTTADKITKITSIGWQNGALYLYGIETSQKTPSEQMKTEWIIELTKCPKGELR